MKKRIAGIRALKAKDTKMTEGPIAKQMIGFAVPLFIGNLFQQLYNTADALIVGKLVGNSALAAVSSTGSLIFMLVGFFVGLSMGAGVAIARYYGAGDNEKLRTSVHTNLSMSFFAALFLTAVGALFTPAILRWMGTPEDIFDMAASYIRIYFLGSLGMVFYNALRGTMQAVGDSRNPLIYLVICSVLNVVLDIVFIRCFHWGVEGAAIATVLSQLVSAVLCLVKLMRTDGAYRVSFKYLCVDGFMLKLITKYGLPSGLQNSVIALANVVVQSNINAFGTMAVAGCGAYSKIEGFAFLPVTSFTAAITTFVSQNLGAGIHSRAKKGAGFGLLCCVVCAEVIGLILYLSAPFVLHAFTDEPEAIAFGVQKMRICALFYCLLAASHSFAAILRGAGKSVVPMVIMLSFWCVVRVTILTITAPLHNIAIVNWVYPVTWTLSTLALTIYILKADWVHNFDFKDP